MKDYLPPALQEPLALLLTEFVFLPWREARRAVLNGASQGGTQAQVDSSKAEEVQVRGWGKGQGFEGSRQGFEVRRG